MRPQRKTFAVSLLSDGRAALVAGGGRVALRKTRSLLAAGVRVTLVAPEFLPEFAELPVVCRRRPFEPGDAAGSDWVFACTDDRAVNRAVLEAARAEGALCCRADGAWDEGDFIVPAQLLAEDCRIAVSTDGRSCRSAKALRDELARHLACCTPGALVVCGAPCAAPEADEAALEARLRPLSGLYGWVFLRTCDRTELIAWAADGLWRSGLLQTLLPVPSAYTYAGRDAERHLAFVLAGLRARLAGEFHIVGQVRAAFERARGAGRLPAGLQEAYVTARSRAVRLREAVRPLMPEVEPEKLALDGAVGRVVIAGTGALGQAASAEAGRRGLRVTVLYRTHPLDGADCLPLACWEEALDGADRFLCALRAPAPLFDAARIPCPVYDLGAPRNVTDGPNVTDLDALRDRAFAAAGVTRETLEAAAEAAWHRETDHV